MEKLIIHGGTKLNGSVQISGAKNAALPLMAATLLAKGSFNIKNVPHLRDIITMTKLLSSLGMETSFENNELHLDNPAPCNSVEANYDLVKTMRASILVLGPLLARCGHAKVSLPGGCAIGARPVDLHISALEKMGADIRVDHGYIEATCERLQGAEIEFEKITVTGTENLLMAATLAKGTTVLKNAALEPEIVDLANFLRAMGANIKGDGTSTITIEGVDELHGATHSVMPDRIEAGTFLCAVCATGGKLTLNDACANDMMDLIGKLREAGLTINIIDDRTIEAEMTGDIMPVSISTEPYPGFPTDMQAQFMAVMLKACGKSYVNESIFENRFMHVSEFMRMGGDLVINHDGVEVNGVENFSGSPVMASDLRASAGLVIAALMADNTSEVRRIYHLDRGYDAFEKKLASVGANITRVKDDE